MSVITNRFNKQINWSTLVLFTLGFWLSGSLILDFVIIPSLFASGMMAESGFAGTGYLIFGVFNRIELICGALVASSFLIFHRNHNLTNKQEPWAMILAIAMLTIATIYTYILTPQMSGLGMQLNMFSPVTEMSAAMISLHWIYWVLEAVKLLAGAVLLRWSYHNSFSMEHSET
jgi:hypothetical protein